VTGGAISAAREEVLGRVRTALGRNTKEMQALPAYRRIISLGEGGRLELLAQRLADYKTEVVRVVASELTGAIAAVAPGARLGVPPGLSPQWRTDACVDDCDLSVLELDALDGALTGCTVAIAETGTLVLAGGLQEGRRALTLVPDLHICVVEPKQVVETVPQAFDRLAPFATRPLTFISGPSATSDIELRRVEGVHGPRRLVVLITTDGALSSWA
jgi:L-lactate dehydrogenase complex protein LldG